MAASLKHELRTPLNHIIGYCEMLIEEAQDQGRDAWLPDLERIHSAGKRLLTVVNDLFEPSKAEAMRGDQHRLDHELRTPLNQIIGYSEMLQEEAREQKLESFLEDLGRIHSAAHRLLQLVVEHFVPVSGAAAAPGAVGSGEATTFLRASAERARERAAATHAVEPGLPGSLLVVDDDEANRLMLARRLVRLGHQVTLAENGRVALEKLRASAFDLVLLDIQMPEMNGYEVLEQLQADPALRTLPVIVLSASSETDRVAHCIEMGAEDYLPKPFDPVLLQARISACLEKKRLRDREQLHLRQIQDEREKSEQLLLNILPPAVAARLKQGEGVIADNFPEATVLFADLVGFTSLSLNRSPRALLELLNVVFSAFDGLVAELGLEKIKTIGDAYMVAAGVPLPRADHVEASAALALRMLEEMQRLNASLGTAVQIRIGLHTGSVVAGVIGRHKFAYDLWGDTVNTASRMESHSLPGQIHISTAVEQRLRARYRCVPRGEIEVKGIGPMATFFLEGVVR